MSPLILLLVLSVVVGGVLSLVPTHATGRVGWFLVLLGTAPLLSMLLATGAAGILGCNLSGAGPSACHLLGVDLGSVLYNMSAFSWFFILSLPISVVLGFSYAVCSAVREQGTLSVVQPSVPADASASASLQQKRG